MGNENTKIQNERIKGGSSNMFPCYRRCCSRLCYRRCCQSRNGTSYSRLLDDGIIGEKLFDQIDLITEIEKSELALIVSHKPNHDTVISVTTPWRATQSAINGGICLTETLETTALPSVPSVDELKKNGNNNECRPKLNEALADVPISLQKDCGNLRCGQASSLSCSLVASVVSKIDPICDIFKAQLNISKFRLHVLEHRWSDEESKIVVLMKRELDWLYTDTEPLLIVIEELTKREEIVIEELKNAEETGAVVGRELEEEEILEILEKWKSLGQQVEDLRRRMMTLSSGCDVLMDELSFYQGKSENYTLFAVTIMSVIFVPSQCVLAYFSMNLFYVDENEEEIARPEPIMTNGNATYWIALFSAIATIVTAMMTYLALVLRGAT